MRRLAPLLVLAVFAGCTPSTPADQFLHRFAEAASLAYEEEPNGADYWQTPCEFLLAGVGDCEDGAHLLQYVTGCRIVFGWYDQRAGGVGQGHAWCEVKMDGQWWIADPAFGVLILKSRKAYLTYVEVTDSEYIRKKQAEYTARLKRGAPPQRR